MTLMPPHRLIYEETVRRALKEDLGRAGDLTTDAIVSASASARAEIVARQGGRLAGLPVAAAAFDLIDTSLRMRILIPDGQDAGAGDPVAVIEGPARALLSAERTALNFLGRLSGIATATRDICQAIQGTKATIVCTRKTTPGLRTLEKYAVRAGGGSNHRFGLDDAVLIKDNHLVMAGSIRQAVRSVRRSVGHLVKIEVEVERLDQLEEALQEEVDAVLLDNMDLETLCQAVQMAAGKAITEVSGGITLETAPQIASTGADLLSVGWLTHSAPALDLSLDFKPSKSRSSAA